MGVSAKDALSRKVVLPRALFSNSVEAKADAADKESIRVFDTQRCGLCYVKERKCITCKAILNWYYFVLEIDLWSTRF